MSSTSDVKNNDGITMLVSGALDVKWKNNVDNFMPEMREEYLTSLSNNISMSGIVGTTGERISSCLYIADRLEPYDLVHLD